MRNFFWQENIKIYVIESVLEEKLANVTIW
jgi:hypothetical protein